MNVSPTYTGATADSIRRLYDEFIPAPGWPKDRPTMLQEVIVNSAHRRYVPSQGNYLEQQANEEVAELKDKLEQIKTVLTEGSMTDTERLRRVRLIYTFLEKQ